MKALLGRVKLTPVGGGYWRALGWWLARGAGCALASFALAIGVGGLDDGGSIAAMAAGVATWCVVCARVSSSRWFEQTLEPTAWGDAWWVALRIRLIVTAGAGGLVLALMLAKTSLRVALGLLAPELWLGMFASMASGVMTGSGVMRGGSAGVYLLTLVQGALVLATIGLLAVVVRGFWWCRGRTRADAVET